MSPLNLRLRQLRQSRDLSQEQLAHLASVRQATISTLETGRSRRADFDVLERLAKALGVAPHELFETLPPPRRR